MLGSGGPSGTVGITVRVSGCLLGSEGRAGIPIVRLCSWVGLGMKVKVKVRGKVRARDKSHLCQLCL